MTPIEFIGKTLKELHSYHVRMIIALDILIFGIGGLILISKGINLTGEMIILYLIGTSIPCAVISHFDWLNMKRVMTQAYDRVQSENVELATAILEKKVYYKPEIKTILHALSEKLDNE